MSNILAKILPLQGQIDPCPDLRMEPSNFSERAKAARSSSYYTKTKLALLGVELTKDIIQGNFINAVENIVFTGLPKVTDNKEVNRILEVIGSGFSVYGLVFKTLGTLGSRLGRTYAPYLAFILSNATYLVHQLQLEELAYYSDEDIKQDDGLHSKELDAVFLAIIEVFLGKAGGKLGNTVQEKTEFSLWNYGGGSLWNYANSLFSWPFASAKELSVEDPSGMCSDTAEEPSKKGSDEDPNQQSRTKFPDLSETFKELRERGLMNQKVIWRCLSPIDFIHIDFSMLIHLIYGSKCSGSILIRLHALVEHG